MSRHVGRRRVFRSLLLLPAVALTGAPAEPVCEPETVLVKLVGEQLVRVPLRDVACLRSPSETRRTRVVVR